MLPKQIFVRIFAVFGGLLAPVGGGQRLAILTIKPSPPLIILFSS